jgi:hypothetical protein
MRAILRFSFSAMIIYALFITGCSNPNSPESPEVTNNLSKIAPEIENLSSDLVLSGSGFISNGVGTRTQPANFNIDVPAGVTITKVLLYWGMRDVEGGAFFATGDNEIVVNGTTVQGEWIGHNLFSSHPINSHSFRADITNSGIVTNGNNAIIVDGMGGAGPDGASIVVVYDDGTNSVLEIKDGLDFAYVRIDPPLPELINANAYTFTFPAAASARTASLTLLAGDVDLEPTGEIRTNTLKYWIDGGSETTIQNPLFAANGNHWDNYLLDINIPAGATELTVQLISGPDLGFPNPSSFIWIAAGLSIPEGVGCTLTPGYWKTHSEFGPAPYDNTWALILPSGASSPFFLSGQTYYQVLWTEPSGNAYYILAHAYIAAQLNQLNGTSIPADVLTAFNTATTLFNTYTPAQIGVLKGSSALRQQFVSLAGILDDYNNGITGPGHCPD